jgi:acylphosphatase
MASGHEMKKVTVHICADGGVQGVGYRAFVESNASQLSIDGWVRNRRDGSVEAVFRGSPDDVAELIERCRQGPAAALVTGIDVCEVHDDVGMGFVVLPTA